jgi:hypothetical protein
VQIAAITVGYRPFWVDDYSEKNFRESSGSTLDDSGIICQTFRSTWDLQEEPYEASSGCAAGGWSVFR